MTAPKRTTQEPRAEPRAAPEPGATPDPVLAAALDGIAAARAWLDDEMQRPVVLSDAYLRAIEWLESLPENQSGADKSALVRTDEAWHAHYRRAKLVR